MPNSLIVPIHVFHKMECIEKMVKPERPVNICVLQLLRGNSQGAEEQRMGWGEHDKKKNKDVSEFDELFSQKYSDPVLITPPSRRVRLCDHGGSSIQCNTHIPIDIWGEGGRQGEEKKNTLKNVCKPKLALWYPDAPKENDKQNTTQGGSQQKN